MSSGLRHLARDPEVRAELRLGALLTVTALVAGGFFGMAIPLAIVRDILGLSALQFGFITLAFSIGGLAGIAFAVIVDRRGPYRVIPAGAVVAGIGIAASGFALNFALLVVIAAVIGVGVAAMGVAILSAVAARGCYRIRGAVLGAVALALGLEPLKWALDAPVDIGDIRLLTAVIGLVFLALAAATYRLLPTVFPVRHDQGNPLPQWRRGVEEEMNVSGRELVRNRTFWKSVVLISVVMSLSRGLFTPIYILDLPLASDILGLRVSQLLAPAAAGVFALAWGIAGDFARPRLLMLLAAAMALVGTLLLGTGTLTPLGVLLFAVFRGAALVLPWVLLADYVGVKYMATIGAVMLLFPISGLLSAIIPLTIGVFFDRIGTLGVTLALVIFALIIAGAASRIVRVESKIPVESTR